MPYMKLPGAVGLVATGRKGDSDQERVDSELPTRRHRSRECYLQLQENNPRRWTDDKALWMNAEYIRTMPLEELLPMVKTELRAPDYGAKSIKKRIASG